ncbi:3'-5' exonuclease [uncultured Imperialibacter sp.]|uniref:3'-5' exonuclease n=1 Tax=uncultured Imperialibacter sp. TaxID=1672639 RepID=UPI0030D94235|tara:strand:+ start:144597 stop:145331 length:735 start_codon:yes stop_codon:yes gene_type:complete
MAEGTPKKILFIDIETVAGARKFTELDPIWQKLWSKKAVSLSGGNEEVDAAEMYENRAAIYSEFGKVIVIGLGYFAFNEDKSVELRVTSLSSNDEHQLLTSFQKLMEQKFNQGYFLCAHNGKEFDYPYLCRRMTIHGISLPDILRLEGKKPWEVPHLDTMEMWKYGDRKSFTSLQLLTTVLGIPSPKDDIDGSMVNEVYYGTGDIDRIARYCKNDVVATAQVFLRLHQQPTIPKDKILFVDFNE